MPPLQGGYWGWEWSLGALASVGPLAEPNDGTGRDGNLTLTCCHWQTNAASAK